MWRQHLQKKRIFAVIPGWLTSVLQPHVSLNKGRGGWPRWWNGNHEIAVTGCQEIPSEKLIISWVTCALHGVMFLKGRSSHLFSSASKSWIFYHFLYFLLAFFFSKCSPKSNFIDPIHKWLPIHNSFVLVQISLPSLIVMCQIKKNSCSKVRLGRLICTIIEQKQNSHHLWIGSIHR